MIAKHKSKQHQKNPQTVKNSAKNGEKAKKTKSQKSKIRELNDRELGVLKMC